MERLFFDIGYTHDFSEAWSLSTNFTHNYFDGMLGEAPNGVSHHTSKDYLGEVSVNGAIQENVNVVVGGILDTRTKQGVPDDSAIKEEYNHKHVTGYAQVDYRPIEALKLIAGAQVNKPEGNDVDLVPRLGAIYNFESGLGLKALYGQAFRTAWPGELLIDIKILHGNPDLQPEKITTTDFQVFYAKENFDVSFTYFMSQYSNLINRVGVTDPGLIGQTFVNSGEMDVTGFELEGKYAVSKQLYFVGSYTNQKNQDDVTFTPNAMAKAGAIYNTEFGLSVGVFNTYFGEPQENGAPELNPAAEAVNLLSMNVNYQIPGKLPLEVYFYGKNMLDSDYYFTEFSKKKVNTLPMESGRSVYAGIRYTL